MTTAYQRRLWRERERRRHSATPEYFPAVGILRGAAIGACIWALLLWAILA
jgi:hypothetical protein